MIISGLQLGELLLLSVVGGGDAGVGLEVFAECELLGEAEPVGYLLHLQVAMKEKMLGLADDEEVNPLHWRLAGVPDDERREVPHRQGGLGGIVGHWATFGIML